MKTFLIAASAVAALNAAPAQAWWDNGHMLVGEIAAQLMDPADVKTIEKALSAWEDDFPNTSEISSAAIWPDLVKCSSTQPFCNTTAVPSFSSMDKWHYVNLPLFANGARWGDAEPDLTLFAQSFGGDAADVVDQFLKLFSTSKSTWSVNLGLRQLIHILGDLHNPMHAVGAVNAQNPKGDSGGNNFRFKAPCVGSNLHALYDAAGGELTNNWAPVYQLKDELKKNATELIKTLPIIQDTADMSSIKDLGYPAFVDAFIKGSYFKKFILESYNVALKFVYPSLDLTYVGTNTVACPPDWYVQWSTQLSKFRIALAGKRLAVVLTQVAKQLRTNSIV